jgi:predicted nuclease with RNAse H fold
MREAKVRVAIAGVDLAARNDRPTGVAVAVCNRDCMLRTVISRPLTDDEILQLLERHGVRIAVIDAPLQLPRSGGYRAVERKFMSIGARLLPLTLKSMRMLALRGMRLANMLRSRGVEVYETHPRSVLLICRLEDAVALAERVGVKTYLNSREIDRHAEDAIVALAVGVCVYRGCASLVRDVDGAIAYIPNDKCKG